MKSINHTPIQFKRSDTDLDYHPFDTSTPLFSPHRERDLFRFTSRKFSKVFKTRTSNALNLNISVVQYISTVTFRFCNALPSKFCFDKSAPCFLIVSIVLYCCAAMLFLVLYFTTRV